MATHKIVFNCVLIYLIINYDLMESKNILMITPLTSHSHKTIFDPIATAMAQRGHHVTLVTSGTLPPERENVTMIVGGQVQKLLDLMARPIEWRRGGFLKMLQLPQEWLYESCHEFYKNEKFMELLQQKIDLIYLEGFTHSCFLGFIHKTKAPFVTVFPLPVPSSMSQFTEIRLPPSFVPGFGVEYSDKMTFFQRLFNSILNLAFDHVFFHQLGKQSTAIYREYLGHEAPDAEEVLGDVSMIMTNSHFAMNYPRPTLPDILEIGGIHCRPPRALPIDLKEFCDGSGPDGFIVFSLGSIVQGHMMPEHIRKTFLNVFSRLKQRVGWKWESDVMAVTPPNVKIVKWLPQQDILGHSKIKMFLSHGGLLSTQEAIYHGVPVIGIPVFADQYMNIAQGVKKGYALSIEILDVTEEILESAINRILNEEKFSERAKEISRLYKDQMNTPLERAVFWSEYLMRHQGAPYLRSGARNLNFIQYHSIDTIAAISCFILAVLWLLKILLFSLFRKMCRNSNNQNFVKKRN